MICSMSPKSAFTAHVLGFQESEAQQLQSSESLKPQTQHSSHTPLVPHAFCRTTTWRDCVLNTRGPPEIMAKWPRVGLDLTWKFYRKEEAAKTGKEGQVKVELLDEPVLGWTKRSPHQMAQVLPCLFPRVSAIEAKKKSACIVDVFCSGPHRGRCCGRGPSQAPASWRRPSACRW